MNLSEHFTLEEACVSQTAIRKGISNAPNEDQLLNLHEAAAHLELVRSLLGKPIHVDSWLRVPKLNIAVGGSKTSAHMDGWAIDFTAPEFGTPLEIARAIASSGIAFDQIIMEGSWVHISFAPEMRRQTLTAHFANGGVTYTKGI